MKSEVAQPHMSNALNMFEHSTADLLLIRLASIPELVISTNGSNEKT